MSTRYNTGNPIESTDVRDMSDNAKNFDEFSNSMSDSFTDRLGRDRQTIEGSIRKAGFQPVSFDFVTGGTLVSGDRNKAVFNPEPSGDNNWYAWQGAFPKVISSSSTPATSGGLGENAWKPVTNSILAPTVRESIRRSYAEAGYNLVDGSFESGGTLVNANDVLLHEASGKAFSGPAGPVADGTDPARGGFVDRSGSATAFIQEGAGAVPRTAQDKMRERITPMDFGAVGDGVINDQLAFDTMALSPLSSIDGLGKTYLLNSYPSLDKFINCIFLVGGEKKQSKRNNLVITNWDTPLRSDGPGSGVISVGTNAALNIPSINSSDYKNFDVIAIGRDALKSATQAPMNIAIGANTLSKGVPGGANIAIGAFSLTHVDGDKSSVSSIPGSRNIGIGTLTGHFIDKGNRNVLVGRDSGHAITTGEGNVSLGYGALMTGHCPVGLSGSIENQAKFNGVHNRNVGIGNQALSKVRGNFNIGIGNESGANLKIAYNNILIGTYAGKSLAIGSSFNNKLLVTKETTRPYTQTGNNIVISIANSGAIAGNYMFVTFTTGGVSNVTREKQWVVVSSVDASTITITSPQSMQASGNCVVHEIESNTPVSTGDANVVIGHNAAANAATIGGSNVIIGENTGLTATGVSNTLLGARSGYNLTTGSNNTFVGFNAGRAIIQGGALDVYSNVSCLGVDTAASGDNQVQLGNASTTTYVYGTVQNRSDERDKADVRDTALGIEFIMGLRPVDGRWDMRDDYREEYQVQVGIDDEANPVFETRYRQLPKDGSKARKRFHHWFIAQEVKELCDKLGVDFGGYQDHSLNDGRDVKTLGYDEFIPPTVKAVQQCWNRLDELEKRIAKLE